MIVRRAAAALVLLVLVAAGCGEHGLSDADKQFAETLLTALDTDELMAPVDACSGVPCLRKTGPTATAKLGRRVALLERELPAVEDGCLRDAAGPLLLALRSYRTAAQLAAQGREDSLMRAETRAGGLMSRSVEAIVDCIPGPAGSREVLHAVAAMGRAAERLDRCTDAGCRAREAPGLGRFVEEQRLLLDGIFGEESECVLHAKAELDRGFDAMQRAVEALARDDESASEVAAASAARSFRGGLDVLEDCDR